VSTLDQTTANQERELRETADRMGCEIVKVYKDHGISGTRGRDKRPAFDKLCRDAARREFDMVMAWSVDRLGRHDGRSEILEQRIVGGNMNVQVLNPNSGAVSLLANIGSDWNVDGTGDFVVASPGPSR
jgi:hypothetical protein